MTTKTKVPNTAARAGGIPPDVENHTREMLESILRPHSLEELYALVGSFPFKAVKVCQIRIGNWPIGHVINVVSYNKSLNRFLTDEIDPADGLRWATWPDLKQWRLAGD